MLRKILLTSTIAGFVLSMAALAFEFVEDFSAPALNQKVWDIKTAGKASFQIEKGILTMEAPGVDSGIILYHPHNIQDLTSPLKSNSTCQGLWRTSALALYKPFSTRRSIRKSTTIWQPHSILFQTNGTSSKTLSSSG